MDIAASVVAFVGIAGQLLQGVCTVYTFLSDVQDAPEEIQQLNAELNLLRMILENMITYPQGICGSKEAFDSVGLAMEMVQSQVKKLKELVEKYNIKGVGRRKLVWSNINIAFRKKKFAKYISNLDRARKLLEMARSSVESRTRTQQTELLHTIHRDVSFLRDSHQAAAAIVVQSSIAGQEGMDEAKVKNAASVVITEGNVSMHGNGGDSREQVAANATQTMLSNLDTPGSAPPPWLTEHAMRKLMVRILKENQQIFSKIEDSHRDSDVPEMTSSKTGLHPHRQTIPNGFGEVVHFTKINDKVAPTVYHSPWVGTVRVIRKSTVKKVWDTKDKVFETQHQIWQTYIHLKPASWLSQLGVDLTIQTTQAVYGSTKIESAIEPVRYVDIPPAARYALHRGDIATVQHMLSAGEISLRDRDIRTGDNLFRIGLHHFGEFWYTDEQKKLLPSHLDIVSISLWLLSQGLKTDIQSDDSIISDWKFTEAMREHGGDVYVNVSNMERLLLEITEAESPIMRAKKLLIFAIVNPDHSRHLESIIKDLLEETPTVKEVALLQSTERKLWENGDLLNLGIECMVLNSYFTLKGEAHYTNNKDANKAAVEEALKGPRRILLDQLTRKSYNPGLYNCYKEHTADQLHLLNLFSKFISILDDDGFVDHATSFACLQHSLHLWRYILQSIRYPVMDCLNRHLSTEPQLHPPLRILLGPSNDSRASMMLVARDPHAIGDEETGDVWDSIESYDECTYDSHQSTGVPDICFVRKEGTELHFDCAVMDPRFDCAGHWEAERRYWSEFNEADRRYTHKEFKEAEAEAVEPPPMSTPGILSRLVSEGASIITSIV
ncbi:MAG: hypothetical protein Q9187_007345 [Circinaria calcarea]